MSGRVHRDFRRQASQAARRAVDTLAPGVTASLENERLTRERVALLEAWAQAFSRRRFLGRLKWFFLGR